jgi:hypothetical protein
MAEVVTVCSIPFEEAWLMAGRLRAEGIPATVYPEDYTTNIGYIPRSFDVIVRKDQLEEARRIAAQYVEPS